MNENKEVEFNFRDELEILLSRAKEEGVDILEVYREIDWATTLISVRANQDIRELIAASKENPEIKKDGNK